MGEVAHRSRLSRVCLVDKVGAISAPALIPQALIDVFLYAFKRFVVVIAIDAEFVGHLAEHIVAIGVDYIGTEIDAFEVIFGAHPARI